MSKNLVRDGGRGEPGEEETLKEVTERLAREESLKSVVTPTPVPSPIKFEKELAPTPGPPRYRTEPGETAPPIGYDPKVVTGEYEVKTAQDAENYVRHMNNYGLHLESLANVNQNKIDDIASDMISVAAQRASFLASDVAYTQESLDKYNAAVDQYLQDANKSVKALSRNVDNLNEGISVVDNAVERFTGYPETATTRTTYYTVTDPRTGKVNKFDTETEAKEFAKDLQAGRQARRDYWSTQTPQYKSTYDLVSRGIIEGTKTDKGISYSVVTPVDELSDADIRLLRIMGFNIPSADIPSAGKGKVQLGTGPEIIWDPGYGPTGVTDTNPVMEVLKSWSTIIQKQATWLAVGLGLGETRSVPVTEESQVTWDPGYGTTGVTAVDTNLSLPNILNSWAAFNDKLYERGGIASEKEQRAMLLALKNDPLMSFLTFAQYQGVDPPATMDEFFARIEYRLSEGLLGYARNWAFPFSLTAGKPRTGQDAAAQVMGSVLLSLIMPTTADRLFTLAIQGIYKSGSAGVGLLKKFLGGTYMTPNEARRFEKLVGQYGYSTSDLRKGVVNLQMGTSIVDDISSMTPEEAIQWEKLIGQYGYSTNDLRKGSVSLLDVTESQLDEILKGYKDYFDFWSKNPELYGAGAAYKPALLQEFEDVFTDLGFDVDEYINYLDKWKLGPTLNPAVLMAFTQGIKPPSSEDTMYKDVISQFDANMQIPDIELGHMIEESIIPVQEVPSIETTDILPLEITVPDIDFSEDEDEIPKPVPPIIRPPDVVPVVIPDIITDIIPDIIPPIEVPDVTTVPAVPFPIDPIERQVEEYKRKLKREGKTGIDTLVQIFRKSLKAKEAKRRKQRKQKPSSKNQSYRVYFVYPTGASEAQSVAAKKFREAFYIGNRIRKIKLHPKEIEIEFRGKL